MSEPKNKNPWENLRPKFEELLYTWQLREAKLRLEDAEPAPRGEDDDWQDRYEARYGVGDLELRRHVLDEMLTSLQGPGGEGRRVEYADPELVLAALRQARDEANDVLTSRIEARVAKQLVKLASDAREALRSAATQFLELREAAVSKARDDTTAACLVILRDIETHPRLNPPRPIMEAAQRQSDARKRPWLHAVRTRLAAAHVSAVGDQTRLLVAVGLLPTDDLPPNDAAPE